MMERKNTAYRLFIVYLIACFVSMLPITVWAQETTLTTVVPSSHTLYIELTGDASLVIDGVAYTKSAEIQIQRHSRPQVSLRVADGYRIKSVFWNDVNIADTIRKGSWTAPEVTEDVYVVVTFGNTGTTPPTGDVFLLELWVSIAALSLLGTIACLLAHKKSKT